MRYEYDSRSKTGAQEPPKRTCSGRTETNAEALLRATLNRCSPPPHETWVVPHDGTETHTPNQLELGSLISHQLTQPEDCGKTPYLALKHIGIEHSIWGDGKWTGRQICKRIKKNKCPKNTTNVNSGPRGGRGPKKNGRAAASPPGTVRGVRKVTTATWRHGDPLAAW